MNAHKEPMAARALSALCCSISFWSLARLIHNAITGLKPAGLFLCSLDLLAEREGFESASERKLNNMQGHGWHIGTPKSADTLPIGSQNGLQVNQEISISPLSRLTCSAHNHYHFWKI